MTGQAAGDGAATRRSRTHGWGGRSPPTSRWSQFDSRVKSAPDADQAGGRARAVPRPRSRRSRPTKRAGSGPPSPGSTSSSPPSSPPRCCGRSTSGHWVRDAIRSRARGGAGRGAGPGRGARGVHQDRARRDRAGRDERADRGGVRALGLPRRRPEPAHPRRRLVEGPGDGREVAVAGRAAAVPDDRRGVGGVQHRVRGAPVGAARRHLHRPPGHLRRARAGAGDHRRAAAR